jgi:uncharacterized protein (DUF1919 family)
MEKCEYGVMTYNKNFEGKYRTNNISDYIQSITASTFFEKMDYYLEKEELDDTGQAGINKSYSQWLVYASPDN